MFLDCVPRDDAMAVIDEWKDALQTARVALEREHEEASRRSGVEGEGFSVLRQLLARRLRHLASDLAFLDELRVVVEEWHAPRPGEGDGSAHDPPFEGCDAGAREDARGGIGHAMLR
jgi:hypothetical protein